jgi:hypothetical protein
VNVFISGKRVDKFLPLFLFEIIMVWQALLLLLPILP